MSTLNARRPAFVRRWWVLLLLALLPLAVLLAVGSHPAPLPERLAMPLFVVALFAMFVSLPLFRRFKHALIACQRALGGVGESAAWLELAQAQRNGLLGALLPAWFAAFGRLAELHLVPVLLLVFASLVIAILYRLPRQLG